MKTKRISAVITFIIGASILWCNEMLGDEKLFLAKEGSAVSVIQLPEKNCPPLLNFAATELQKYLKKISGADIPIEKGIRPSKAGISRILLGDCEESRNAGLDVNSLPPDGFYIWTKENTLYLCGRDDRSAAIKDVLNIYYTPKSRGTLLAVYFFLEEYCGVRWLFPGEYGEYIPEDKNLSIPSVQLCEKPSMDMRIGGTLWGCKDLIDIYGEKKATDEYNLFMTRMRYSSWIMAKSHYFAYKFSASRWVETHPEYFAVGADGKRDKNHTSQGWWLDFTNPDLAHEVALDAIAYFKGQPAENRGLPQKQFDTFGFRRESLAVNPSDRPLWSYNPECEKYKDADGDYSELAWKYYKQISDEVGKECPDKLLSVWSYQENRKVPKSLKKAPENVRIYLVTGGPYDWIHAQKRLQEETRMKEWYKFSGHKLYLWVNAQLRACRENILGGVPSPILSELGAWIKFIAPYSNGVYYSNNSNNYFFEASNVYTAFHMFWNAELDEKKLLEDYYQKAYGPAALEIKEMECKFEDIWKNNIMTPKFKEGATMMGDKKTLPSKMEVWEDIYNEKIMDEFQKKMEKAIELVRGTQFEKRVELFNKYYWGNIVRTREDYFKQLDNANDMIIRALKTSKPVNIDGKLDEESWSKCSPGSMSPVNENEKSKVETEVRLLYDDKNIYIGFKCYEPLTNALRADAKKHDDPIIWKDDEVETFIDPSCSRRSFYQILANTTGKYTDYKYKERELDINWNPDLRIAVAIERDFWSMEIAISFSELGTSAPKQGDRWAANFCRGRSLDAAHQDAKQFLTWSRFVKGGFQNPQSFGVVLFTENEKKEEGTNLIKNGSFEAGISEWGEKQATIDDKIRWTGFRSIRLEATGTNSFSAALQRISPEKIVPNTDYWLSFYMKTEDIKPKTDMKLGRYEGVGAQLYLGGRGWAGCPDRFVTGTSDWRKYVLCVKSGDNPSSPPSIRFRVYGEGKAWIDDVRLVPAPEKASKSK